MPSIMPGLYHKEQKLYNRGCVIYLWIFFFFFRLRSSNLGEIESQINSLPPKGHDRWVAGRAGTNTQVL